MHIKEKRLLLRHDLLDDYTGLLWGTLRILSPTDLQPS